MAPKWKESLFYIVTACGEKGFCSKKKKNSDIITKSNDIIKSAVNALPNTADSCMFPG